MAGEQSSPEPLSSMSEAERVIDGLREEVRSIRVKLHGAIRKGKASEAARDLLEKRVEELETAVKESHQESNADHQDSKNLNGHTSLNGHASDVQNSNEVQVVYSENETLKQQILELKEKLETADNALQYKESSTANGHHHDDKGPNQVNGRTEREEALNKQISRLRAQNDEAEQNVDVMKEALQAAAEKIQEAEDSSDEAKKEAARFGEEAAESQKHAEHYNEEAARLRQHVASLEGRLSMQEELEAELNTCNKKLEESRDASESLREEIMRGRAECKSQEAENDTLKKKISQLEDQLKESQSEAQNRNDGLAELKQNLQEEIDTARAAKEQTLKELSLAQSSREKADQAVHEAEKRAQIAQEEMLKLQADETSRKQKFSLLHSTFAREKEAILEKLNIAEDRIRSLTASAQAAEDLRDQLSERSKELSELETKLKLADTQISESRQKSEEHASKAENLANKLAEAEGNLQASVESSKEYKLECENLTNMMEETSLENESLATQLKALQDQFHQSSQDLENLRKSLQEAQEQILPSNSSQSEKEPEGEGSNRENNAAILELEEEIHSLRESLRTETRLAGNSTLSQARITSLEKQNQELQWQIAMMNSDPEAATNPPTKIVQPQREAPGGEPVSKAIGLVLRYRRGLIIAYFSVLHILLYTLLSARSHKSHCP